MIDDKSFKSYYPCGGDADEGDDDDKTSVTNNICQHQFYVRIVPQMYTTDVNNRHLVKYDSMLCCPQTLTPVL